MPSPYKVVTPGLRGSDQYSRFLARLARAAGIPEKGGKPDLVALMDRAVAELGLRHGLIAPRRVNPVGFNNLSKRRKTERKRISEESSEGG